MPRALPIRGTVARHPRFVVTDIEKQMGARTTAETLRGLRPLLDARAFRVDHGGRQFRQPAPLARLAGNSRDPAARRAGAARLFAARAGRSGGHALLGSAGADRPARLPGHGEAARLVLHSDAAQAREFDRHPPAAGRAFPPAPASLRGSVAVLRRLERPTAVEGDDPPRAADGPLAIPRRHVTEGQRQASSAPSAHPPAPAGPPPRNGRRSAT